MNLLTLSGSVRPNSYNTALLRALAGLAPPAVEIQFHTTLKDIPIFDPTLVGENTPQIVADFRNQLAHSDGIIISTPEYAHGVPGVLKNALDWVVDAAELVLKPVAVMSVSTSGLGGIRSTGPLITTLTAMNWNVIVEASLNIPFAKKRFDAELNLRDEISKKRVETALLAMERAIRELRA